MNDKDKKAYFWKGAAITINSIHSALDYCKEQGLDTTGTLAHVLYAVNEIAKVTNKVIGSDEPFDAVFERAVNEIGSDTAQLPKVPKDLN